MSGEHVSSPVSDWFFESGPVSGEKSIFSLMNPFKMGLWVTSGVCIPSYISLIMFSVTIFHITNKHFNKLADLYLSVMFYLVSQLLLLIVITTSWILELARPAESEQRCRVKLAVQTFAMILPGYCILIITVVRSIFVTVPLGYMDYLKKRNQVIGMVVSGGIAGVIAGLPSMGLCGTRVRITFESGGRHDYCSFGDLEEPTCRAFSGVLLGAGFCVPIVSTVCLYLYIYQVAVKARRSHRRLTESGLTSSSFSDKKKERSGNLETSERSAIPWSIIVTVLIAITTTLPWALVMLYSVELTETLAENEKLSIVFDLFYAVLQVLVGISPLAYILTTNSIRVVFVRLLRKGLCGRCLTETPC